MTKVTIGYVPAEALQAGDVLLIGSARVAFEEFDVTGDSFYTIERDFKMRTIDRVEITDDLPVWDYDLRAVRVDLSKRVHCDGIGYTDPDRVWFSTKGLDENHRGGGSMNMSRVWRYHPTTGLKPEDANK